MKYRKEIDGLRAVAVLPVVLFHAGFSIFSGGFVGVDVFFVISGYLITSIIVNELAAGTFSILAFYERRARRILPALFAVLLFTLPFAATWMQADALDTFSRSLVSVAAYVSNFFFWRQIGYFTPSAELSPLLHTWSLAVEEQYYVLFPALMIVLWRFGRRVAVVAVAFIAVASLLIAEWATVAKPIAGYYLLPSRAFELLIGSLLAVWAGSWQGRWLLEPQRRPLREALAGVGLAMILYAIFFFDGTLPFPGRYALVPTMGAALIIAAATPETATGRILANPLFVAIGVISYSLYLWHQPLFAFARLRSLAEPPQYVMLAISALAVALAWLSWRYVESPFRDRKRTSNKTIWLSSAAATFIAIAIGMTGALTHGLGNRHLADGATYLSLSENLRPNHGLGEDCTNGFTLAPQCRTDDNPEFVVWGDSYAEHHVSGLLETVPGAKLIQMTYSACGPFVGLAPANTPVFTPPFSKSCMDFNDQVLAWIMAHPSVKYVILASNFGQYTHEVKDYLTADGIVPRDINLARASLQKTLDTLIARGIKPVIIGPTPESPENVGAVFGKGKLFNELRASYDFPQAYSDNVQKLTWDLLTPLRDKYAFVDLRDILCTDKTCHPVTGGASLYYDKGHLTRLGSRWVAERMDYRKLLDLP